MALAMSRPWSHPKTGTFYLRIRVPKDLAGLLGKSVEKRALGTKDPVEAKRLHTLALASVQSQWADLRSAREAAAETTPNNASPAADVASRTATLTEREAHQRAVWLYDFWLSKHRDNPSQQTFWRTDLYDRLWAQPPAWNPEKPFSEQFARCTNADALVLERLEEYCLDEADTLLSVRDMVVDGDGRLKLAKALADAMQRASLVLAREARGEFDPTPRSDLRPPAENARGRAASTSEPPLTFSALMAEWVSEKRPRPRTIYEWTRVIGQLVSFLGHDDARRLTTEDLIGWKNAMRAAGSSPKTIKDAKLAPVRAILAVAVDNRRLERNPAERIVVSTKRGIGEEMRGYTNDEAIVVLRAADRAEDAVRRWVPFLCAYSGARLAEVCQLRAEDVVEREGVWVLKIAPDAGPLKNRSAVRLIPLHPVLVDRGFLAFTREVGSGPLFPELPPDKFGKRGGNGTKILSRWVRELGITDPRLQPSHGWRHRFRTTARLQRLAVDVVDAMLGHTRQTVGDNYGEYPPAALLAELEKMPDILAMADLLAKPTADGNTAGSAVPAS